VLDILKQWPETNRNRRVTQLGRSLIGHMLHHRHFVLACLLVGLILRAGWVLAIDPLPVKDARWYYERGLDLAAGRGYTMQPDSYWHDNLAPASLIPPAEYPPQGQPTAFWPVGYPAFLGLLFATIGPSPMVAAGANVGLDMAILLLSFSLATRLFSAVTGRLTLLFLALYPGQIIYTSLLSPEFLFLFLLLSGLAVLVFKQRLATAAAAGVIFGLACLVRPQAFFIPAIFFAITLGRQVNPKSSGRHLKLGLVLYAALALTILPWLIRNYRVFNQFVFISTNSGYNLLLGNNPHATGLFFYHPQLEAMLSDARTEPDRDRKARELAIAYMLNHPLETVQLWPTKLYYLYSKDIKGVQANQLGLEPLSKTQALLFRLLKGVAQLYYMAIGLGALLYLLLFVKDRPKITPEATLGLAIILYFTLIYLFIFGDTHFRFPLMPWLVMYAAAFAAMWLGKSTPGPATTSIGTER